VRASPRLEEPPFPPWSPVSPFAPRFSTGNTVSPRHTVLCAQVKSARDARDMMPEPGLPPPSQSPTPHQRKERSLRDELEGSPLPSSIFLVNNYRYYKSLKVSRDKTREHASQSISHSRRRVPGPGENKRTREREENRRRSAEGTACRRRSSSAEHAAAIDFMRSQIATLEELRTQGGTESAKNLPVQPAGLVVHQEPEGHVPAGENSTRGHSFEKKMKSK